MVVDQAVQRRLDERKVLKIAEDFDINALGVVTVSHRADGTIHVVDGQHRVHAVRLAIGDDAKIQARVFSDLSLDEEARLFRLLNNTSRVGAFDLFRVRVVEGEPDATAINDIIESYGWHLSLAGSAHAFGAVAAMERVYRRHPAVADLTVETLTRAWGHGPITLDGRLIGGMGSLIVRYRDVLNLEDLSTRLAVYPGGPAKLISTASGWHEQYHWPMPRAVAETMRVAYNKGRSSRKLPMWGDD